LFANRFPRALTGPGVSLGTLTAHRQATTVTDATEASKVHQSLDVHVHFPAQVTFNRHLCNFVTQSVELLFGQLANLGGRRNAGGLQQLLSRGATNTKDV